MSIPSESASNELFKFSNCFKVNLIPSEYEKEEKGVKNFLETLRMNSVNLYTSNGQIKLSAREIEILSILYHGFTSKSIAAKLDISTKTVQHHIENIKLKTNLHFKTELIEFYSDKLKKIIN